MKDAKIREVPSMLLYPCWCFTSNGHCMYQFLFPCNQSSVNDKTCKPSVIPVHVFTWICIVPVLFQQWRIFKLEDLMFNQIIWLPVICSRICFFLSVGNSHCLLIYHTIVKIFGSQFSGIVNNSHIFGDFILWFTLNTIYE